MRSILQLPAAYKKLSPAARKRFDSIYSFSLSTGEMVVPESMKPWVKQQFGSVKKVEAQPILKVTNNVVHEGALFNKLRAERPMHYEKSVTKKELLEKAKREPFSDVEANTPEDTFGRLYGKSEISASNVAKYDAIHGLIIFNRADPLTFTEEEVVDHFNAARSWIAAAQSEHPEATYPVIGWNCLWKAAASLVHGHMQVLVGQKEAYATQQLWQEATAKYKRQTKQEYWTNLFKTHESLGLGKQKDGVKVLAHLTPRKEKEVLLLSDEADDTLFRNIYRVLAAYRALGVASFNVALIFPSQKGMPFITRIVDRGSLNAKSTDIGIMELFLNQNVIASDPVKLWKEVKKQL